ncbi:MAG: crossover junction endodeoxyribonuclease RuvC [Candidatus Glassbacteria bacterium]|nr:crossover junction endodeoxyribonuclease RuvC [Candidatus Glassbacteria bacterium]
MPQKRADNRVAGETIIGIDPGGEVTGFGVVRRAGSGVEMLGCGVTRARRGESVAGKLSRIFHFIREQINHYRPCCLVVEDVFYGKNVQSLKAIGQVRGVIILAGALAGLPVHEYSPREVKKSVVGRGDASKEQVQQMVKSLLGLQTAPSPSDTADALAIALCHSHRPNYMIS